MENNPLFADNLLKEIQEGLNKSITEEAKKLWDKKLKEFNDEIRLKESEIIVNLVTEITKRADYSSMQDRLIITIRKHENL